MSRVKIIALVLAAALGGYQGITFANASQEEGAPMPEPARPMMELSPEDTARDLYNSGISHKDRGDKYEQQAAKEEKDRAKNLQRAQDEYKRAQKDFEQAIATDPGMYQAFNGLGYAMRKLGDPARALAAYNQALSLRPGFPDALHYRGVAYLGLNRIEEAKAAYLDLFGRDRKQAAQLLDEMKKWVDDMMANPGKVNVGLVASLSSWIAEREAIAKKTVDMGLSDHKSVWN
jgi:tetratricopeptide (TPR) repeat protein